MKRYGNLYDKIWGCDNLVRAHINASKGKGWYEEVQNVNNNLDESLRNIKEMLFSKTFHTSEYEVFHKKEGDKVRKIYKLPYYPDRIVQWALLQVIEPYLLSRFTQDTYSAIPKMGIHKALSKLQKSVYTNKEKNKYCLKMDVKHYYQSINHNILKRQYRTLFKDEDLLWLLDEIIDSTDTADVEDLKRLNSTGYHVGIPIGNYLSQYSGNFYLSDFDHWLKEEKKVSDYYRYMDDMVILGKSKEVLHDLFGEITEYLWKNKRLKLKPNYQIFPVADRGIDFVGYRIFPGYTLLRKSTANAYKKKMLDICKNGQIDAHDFGSCGSYGGWIVWCNSFRLQQKYEKPMQGKITSYMLNNVEERWNYVQSRKSKKHAKTG